MKDLKKLGATVALTFVLSVSALAGEILTPPCAPPEPGEILTPPCAAAGQIPTPPDTAAPGQTETTFASNTVDILSVAEAAMNLLLFF